MSILLLFDNLKLYFLDRSKNVFNLSTYSLASTSALFRPANVYKSFFDDAKHKIRNNTCVKNSYFNLKNSNYNFGPASLMCVFCANPLDL